MRSRLAFAGAAAGAALLAASALRTVWAERSYEAGLGLADDPRTSPAADLPGRLEAFEEAMRRDPGEALYPLRAAQIRLHRVRTSGGEPDREQLAAVRELIRRAARLRPLDADTRATAAQVERLRRDPAAAVNEAQTALRLAPRAPGVLRTAVSTGLWAWRETRAASCLRLALQGGAGLERIGEFGASFGFAPAFAAARGGLAGDLIEAAGADPALRAFAADRVRASHRDLARTLCERGVAAAPAR